MVRERVAERPIETLEVPLQFLAFPGGERGHVHTPLGQPKNLIERGDQVRAQGRTIRESTSIRIESRHRPTSGRNADGQGHKCHQ